MHICIKTVRMKLKVVDECIKGASTQITLELGVHEERMWCDFKGLLSVWKVLLEAESGAHYTIFSSPSTHTHTHTHTHRGMNES